MNGFIEETMEETSDRVQELFAEANSKKLTIREFAGKIWTGVVQGNIPELAIASMMIEKGSNVRQPETHELIEKLVKLTYCGDSEAVTRALSMICDGLRANAKTEN